MFHRISLFYHRSDKVQFYSIAASIALMILIINAFAFYYPQLPKRIPLFYSLPWGENQLVTLAQFSILPAVIALAILINTFLSWQLHQSQITLKRLLCGSVLVIALLLTITTFKIIFIYV